MTPAEIAATTLAKADLIVDEGNIPYAYQDSRGYLTIGIGTLIDRKAGGLLYPEEIDFIFQNRVNKVLASIRSEAWYQTIAQDPVRLAAIINFEFQLGTGGDEKFPAAFDCIAAKDWAGAAKNLRNSLWTQQTPNRAARVIAMIQTGRHP